MAKKSKTKKDKKDKNENAEPRAEVDAVKGFIVVMVVLIIALGVFIIITMGKLSDYEQSLATAKSTSRKLGNDALQIQAYLKLIKDTDETTLMRFPERFFGGIYGRQDVGISQAQVTLGSLKESVNRRERYKESSWNLDIKNIDRRQATLFLWGVENKSPKARTLEVTMRRNKKAGAAEKWNGAFKIGYRTAGTGK